MKTAKKLSAIILVCVLLMGSLSAGASAYRDPIINPVASADISFDSNVAGLTAASFKKFVKINTQGIVFDPLAIYETGTAFFATPLDDNQNVANAPNPASRVFVDGVTYRADLYLATDNGYDFIYEFSNVTVNGVAVGFDRQDYDVICVSFTFTAKTAPEPTFFEKLLGLFAPAGDEIENIRLTARTNIAGLTPADYEDFITVKTKGISFDGPDALNVYCVTDEKNISYTDKFELGKTYVIEVYFNAEGERFFTPASLLTGTVNGKAADDVDVNPMDNTQACVAFELTVTEKPAASDFFASLIAFFTNLADTIRGLFTK